MITVALAIAAAVFAQEASGQQPRIEPGVHRPAMEHEGAPYGADSATGRELPEVDAKALRYAPEFELSDLRGQRMRLADLEQPIIVLHFWTRFRDCDYDLQAMQGVREKYLADDVAVIGLAYSSGTRGELEKHLESLGVTFTTLMCSNAVRLEYDVATFPMTFLLDKERRLRYWQFGHVTEEHWTKLVAEALKE